MADAREVIERAFRDLLEEMPYRSLTVSDICERAHLSRKSFYVYFHNKEDIVSHIFDRDVVKPLRDINALFSQDQTRQMYAMLYQKIYERIYGDPVFYRSLVCPMKGCDDTFIRVATNAIYALNRELLTSNLFTGDGRKADYIAYFFASSQAMLIQKWICDGMPYTPGELAALYDEMTNKFWLSAF